MIEVLNNFHKIIQRNGSRIAYSFSFGTDVKPKEQMHVLVFLDRVKGMML